MPTLRYFLRFSFLYLLFSNLSYLQSQRGFFPVADSLFPEMKVGNYYALIVAIQWNDTFHATILELHLHDDRSFIRGITHLVNPAALAFCNGKNISLRFPQAQSTIGNQHSNPLDSAFLNIAHVGTI